MPSTYSTLITRSRRLRPVFALTVATGALVPASSQAEEIVADLAPVGIVTATAPAGLSGLALPLIENEPFSGRIASSSGTTVILEGDAASPSSRLAPESRCYLEILSGPFEGERFDVDVAATITDNNNRLTLDLGDASFSTLKTLPVDALASARCALRRHITLSDLPAMFNPPLAGSNNPSLGDAVQVFEAAGFTSYYLRADGQTWRRSGSNADQRNLVIPPDVSILVRLASGPKQWAQTGAVRTNVFRKNLTGDIQSFASGFPVPQSPVELGARTDSDAPSESRWSGSNNPAQADSLLLFTPGTGTFQTYYLRGDGAAWFQMGGTATDLAAEPFVHTSGLTLIDRQNADSGYLILPPSGL
jgi:hypothetical protein